MSVFFNVEEASGSAVHVCGAFLFFARRFFSHKPAQTEQEALFSGRGFS